jgi:hypothetical protein
VLVVVEHRYVEQPAEPALDLEAPRRADILQVDPAEPVTTPALCSTTRVISLTARPREATSSRTVMEWETLGAMVTSVPPFRWTPGYGAHRVR